MTAILNAVFALGLTVMVPAYVMYFTALRRFSKSLRTQHPDIYSRVSFGRVGVLAGGYAALESLRADKALASQLDPAVARELRDTYRYLVAGAACFMVVLFAGLGSSLIAKA